ncbi:HAD-IIA family hydrolase [uncultured Jannaschia sp.]|uniref:HAD-IIA family hydrolase n=1 Tax=uncultured Jannaschia sp. TaxID=293347 RepID=UPI00261F265E|nr:HAD-IIA family hydrolase [uncultured Jannaschia sp.]
MSGAAAAALAWPFDAYCAVADRLPRARFGSGHRSAETLGEVCDPFDVILLDAYGVLNVGEAAIPGASERVAALRRAGKRVMVVSNSAGYPKRVMMARYARLGFDFSPEEVVSSREALLAHLASLPPRRWGLMLNPRYGLEEFDAPSGEFLEDDRAAYDRVEGFLLVGSDGWTEARQTRLEDALRARPRPVLVGNPDIAAPREGGLSREPGHFAHRLADSTGIVPEFFGKPFPAIYDLALGRMSPRPEPPRVLMVGDTLHTDILGGRGMGFATALVTDYGALAGTDVDAAIAISGIRPDFVVRRP